MLSKEKCVKAQIIKVISNEEKYGDFRQLRQENLSLEQVDHWYQGRTIWTYRNRDIFDDMIDNEYWTRENGLDFYDTWIDNYFVISYIFAGKRYEKQVKRKTYNFPYCVGQMLYVTFCKSNPEIITNIFDKDEKSFLSNAFFIGMTLLSIILEILLIVFIVY